VTTGADARSGLIRQLLAFGGVGIIAMICHYGTLVGLVEGLGWRVVPATLAGYVAGGVASYALNRTLTYRSDRPHAQAGWRFALVAAVGFALTWGLMHLFIEVMGLGRLYLAMQVVTTLIVMAWSFIAHKLFTFG
jgi:putative flippase GtrA